MKLKVKRMSELFIDYCILFGTMIIPNLMVNKYFFYKINDVEFFGAILLIILILILLIFDVIIILCKDFIIGYRSVGKKIMKLNIYMNDKVVKNRKILFKRNIYTFFTMPISLITILLENKSIGDYITNTEVKTISKH